jgi:hypothetical protein
LRERLPYSYGANTNKTGWAYVALYLFLGDYFGGYWENYRAWHEFRKEAKRSDGKSLIRTHYRVDSLSLTDPLTRFFVNKLLLI